jgi:hypothetical protein
MSAQEPPEDPNAWDPEATSAVPVGPEPEPTGAGGSGGAGGWGRAPRVEPFAVAALVWAVVSIVVPLIGTIIAFVLAARAADLIRRSHGEKSGSQYVTAARIVAGGVLALWIIGLVGFLALRDDSSSNNVAVPTQPPSTSIAPATSTTVPLTTTSTKPPLTTTSTKPPPTITVVPPPPTTAPPTQPPTTAPPLTTVAPTTVAPTTTKPPPTTSKPPPTTTPDEEKAAKVQAKLEQRVGPSNRGVPADERFVVNYTQGKNLLVTWAINNGAVGEHPTGTPTCSAPPTEAPTSSTSTSSTSSTSSTTTTTTTSTTVPSPPPSSAAGRTTPEQARFEAKQMLASIRGQLTSLKLDVPGVQLVGTYPIEGTTDSNVVQVLYSKATVQAGIGDYKKAFDAPPAEVVQCLNPAFDL